MIPASEIKVIYTGNSKAIEFPFGFKFNDKSDIKVALRDIATEVMTVLTKDYFVDTVKSVVLYPGYQPGQEPPVNEQPEVLPSSKKIIIYRETPLNQTVKLGDKYPMGVVEGMDDKNLMICQELKEKLDRCVAVDIGADINPKKLIDSIFETAAKTGGIKDETEKIELAAKDTLTKVVGYAEMAENEKKAAVDAAEKAAASQTAAEESAKNAAEPIKDAMNAHNADIAAHADIRAALKKAGGVPIGTITARLSKNPEAGELALDTGALISRATYPDLWSWVQTSGAPLISDADWQAQAAVQSSVGAFSTGDGSTTFRLMRLLDYMRGGLTADVGKWQGDAIRNITGKVGATWSTPPAGAFSGSVVGNNNNNGTGGAFYDVSFDASKVVPTADENRPKTIKVLYCIKAFDAETNPGLIDVTKLANDLNAYNTDIRSLITTSTSKVVSTQQVITWRGSLSDSGVVAGTWNPPAGYTREQCVAIASPASAVAQVNTVCASAETDGRVILRSGNTWTITYEVRVLVVAIK